MSDPILEIDPLAPPPMIPTACLQNPPTASSGCSLVVPLRAQGVNEPTHFVRMDRSGQTFVVSGKNRKENLAWVRGFKQLPDVAAYLQANQNSSFLRQNPSASGPLVIRVNLEKTLLGAACLLGLAPCTLSPAFELAETVFKLFEASSPAPSSPR